MKPARPALAAKTLLIVAVVAGSPPHTRAAAPQEPALAAGIRQVDEGDFEGALLTLGPLVESLSKKGGREAAQACLHLGIAHLALGDREAAVGRFREALGHDPSLRVGPERFSPKVIAAFDEARRQRETETAGAGEAKSHTRRTVLLAGTAAAVGGGVLYAVTRGDGNPPAGEVTFSGARFGTPVLDCANGTLGSPLAVAIDLNAENGTGRDVAVAVASAVLFIIASPAVPSEVGFASNQPATIAPSTLRPGLTTLRVQTTLSCWNGEGDPARFNEWRGRVTLAAGAAQVVETADTMRVNLP